MKAWLLAAVVLLMPVTANAQTCAQVRQAVERYGYVRAAAWARVNLTAAQIRRALRCLRSARR